MNFMGKLDAGSTAYVTFHTFDSFGASITMTGFALGDILVYKNGSVTQRSSTAGFTLLDTDGTDFEARIDVLLNKLRVKDHDVRQRRGPCVRRELDVTSGREQKLHFRGVRRVDCLSSVQPPGITELAGAQYRRER